MVQKHRHQLRIRWAARACESKGRAQLLGDGLGLGLAESTMSTAPTTVATAATTAPTATASAVVAVASIDAALTKRLNIFALLLAAPLAAAELILSVLHLARDIVKEGFGLVVRRLHAGRSVSRGIGRGSGSIRRLSHRRSGDRFLHDIMFIELCVGGLKVKICVWHLDLGRTRAAATTAPVTVCCARSADVHLFHLLGEVVHIVRSRLLKASRRIEVRHSNRDRFLGGLCRISQCRGSGSSALGARLGHSLGLLSGLGSEGRWQRNCRQNLGGAAALWPSRDGLGRLPRSVGRSAAGERRGCCLNFLHRRLCFHWGRGCGGSRRLLRCLGQTLGFRWCLGLRSRCSRLLVGSGPDWSRLLCRSLVARGLVCRLTALPRSTWSTWNTWGTGSTRMATRDARARLERVRVPRTMAHRGKLLSRREPPRMRIRHAPKRARTRASGTTPTSHVRRVVTKSRGTRRRRLLVRRTMRAGRTDGTLGTLGPRGARRTRSDITGPRPSLRQFVSATRPPHTRGMVTKGIAAIEVRRKATEISTLLCLRSSDRQSFTSVILHHG